MSDVCLVFLNRLIHLMRGQRAVSGYLRVQNMSDLLFDSIQGDFILERLQLLVRELVFPILAQIANRGTYPDHEICGEGSQPCSSAPRRYKSHNSTHGASEEAWRGPGNLPE